MDQQKVENTGTCEQKEKQQGTLLNMEPPSPP